MKLISNRKEHVNLSSICSLQGRRVRLPFRGRRRDAPARPPARHVTATT